MNQRETLERIKDATDETYDALELAGYPTTWGCIRDAAWLIVTDDDWTSTDIAEAMINNMGLSYNRSGNTITVEPADQRGEAR